MVIKKNGYMFQHGDRISCSIDGTFIKDAKIYINDRYLYLCHNNKNFDGNPAPNGNFGYKYGWNMTVRDFIEEDYTEGVLPYCKDELAKIVLDMIKENEA